MPSSHADPRRRQAMLEAELQKAQQQRLHACAAEADLVEDDGTAVRPLEYPLVVSNGAGAFVRFRKSANRRVCLIMFTRDDVAAVMTSRR